MAGIETSISLKDGVSPALRAMNQALENLSRTLDSVSAKFRNTSDAKGIIEARKQVAQAINDVKRMDAWQTQAIQNDNKRRVSAERRAAAEIAADNRVAQIAENNALKDIKRTEQLINLEEDRINKTQVNNDKVIASATRRAQVELLADNKLDIAEDNRAANALKHEEQLGIVSDRRAANALKHEEQLRALQASNGNKALRDAEKLTQSHERTKQSVEKTIQSQQKTTQEVAKTARTQESVKTHVEKTNNEKLKGVNITKQGVLIQQRTATETQRTARAEESVKTQTQMTNNAFQRGINILRQRLGIEQRNRTEVQRTATEIKRTQTQHEKLNNEKLKGVNITKQGVLTEQRIATETQRTSTQVQKTNNEKLKGVNLTKQGVLTEQRTATEAQRTNNVLQRGINILRQRLGIEQRNKTAVQQTNNAITRGKILKQQLLNITRKNKTAIDQNSKAQQRFNNYVRGGVAESNRLLSNLRNALGMYVGFQSAQGVLNTADTLTTTKARLDLINDGLQTTEQFQRKIYEAAMNSRSGYAETADMVAKLATRAGKIFGSNDEAIAFTNTLQKMFHIAGASTQEMNSASLQLVQALGSGVLRGEELNAVFEAAPNVIQAIADYMNKPIGKIRELAKKGELSASIVKNAMFAAAEDVNKKFEEMPITWAQTWTLFKNQALKAFEPLLKKISAITGSKRFIGFANGAAKAMGRLAEVSEKAFDKASKFAAYLYDSWKKIKPTIYTVTTAIISFGIALSALKVSMAIYNGLSAVMIARQGMLAGATFAATVQATSFNAAVWACPITWFVTGLLAIVTVLGLVAAATYDFESANIDIWATVKKIVGNVSDYIRDVLGKLKTSLSKVWENIIEASHRAVEWVKRNWNSIIQVLGVIVGVFMWLRDTIVSVAKTIGNALMSAMDNVTSLYNQAAQWIKDNWDDIYGTIATVVGAVLWLGEVAVIISKTIADAFVIAFDWASEGCAKVAQVFHDNWGTISSVIDFICNVLLTLVDIIWFVGETLVDVFTWVLDNALTPIWNTILNIGEIFVDVAGWIVDNWSWISSILLGVAVALGVMVIVQYALAAATWLTVFAETALAAIKTVLGFATAALAIATWLLTGAYSMETIMAWAATLPLLAKIVIIGIIIGLIVWLIAKLLEWMGVAQNTCAAVCGIFAWLFATVWNIIVGLWNGLIAQAEFMVDIVLSVVEWFINAFNGGFDSFGAACANLIGQICGWFLSLGKIVTKIIDAIFGTNWTGGLESLKSKVIAWGKSESSVTLDRNIVSDKLGLDRVSATDWYSGTYDAVDGFSKKVGKFTEGIGDFTDKIGDFTKGLKGNGSDALSGLGDKLSGLGNNGTGAINDVLNSLSGFEPVKNAAGGSGVTDLGKALSGGFADPTAGASTLDKIKGNTEDIAKNTGATADNTASSDEDLKYMRRIAEREAMNRYQLTDLKVEMTNNNSISSNVDADEVMMGIVKQITHAAKTNAEAAFSFVF